MKNKHEEIPLEEVEIPVEDYLKEFKEAFRNNKSKINPKTVRALKINHDNT